LEVTVGIKGTKPMWWILEDRSTATIEDEEAACEVSYIGMVVVVERKNK
jgi:hypothetical protein